MTTRAALMNWLIATMGYKSYLEIGVKFGNTFGRIRCEHKESVDPAYPATHKMTSDEFFETAVTDYYGLIFIDGLHEAKQVRRDIENSLVVLAQYGTIVCHDVNPTVVAALQPDRCWTAWHAWVDLRREREDLTMIALPFDYLGVIWQDGQQVYDKPVEYTWEFLEANRTELMNELPVETLREIVIQRAHARWQ